ncbi:lamin tail domain-containing protein [bacterium]|nr:hypothetical protein [bacterium]MBU3955428.1 lamin tail domain-containing protein [bacterium]
MKNKNLIKNLLKRIGTVPILSLLLFSVPVFAVNMLTNPDYETGDITGWLDYAEDVHAATNTIVHSGSWAGMLTDSAGTYCYAYQVCPATPTFLYDFSGWVYLSSGTSAALRVDWYPSADGSGSSISNVSSTTIILNQWVDLNLTGISAPATAGSCRVKIQLNHIAAAGFLLYFDDIVFEEQGTDTTPPATISNLTALTGESEEGTITLTWTAPGDDGTGTTNATSYEVKYATKYIATDEYSASWVNTYSQTWTPAAFGTTEGASGNRVVSGLIQGVSYWFTIKATDDSSNQASWTSSGTASWVNTLNSTTTYNTAPSSPTNLSLGPEDGALNLLWSVNTETDFKQYKIYFASDTPSPPAPESFTLLASTTSLTYKHTPLTNNVTYHYCLKAEDYSGLFSTYSAIKSDYPRLVAPTAPSNFAGTGQSTTSIKWTWANVSGEEGYILRYSTSATVIAGLSAGTTFWIETGLSINTSNYRIVVATNTAGDSPLTSVATSWTLANPPGTSTFGGVFQSSVTLSWAVNSNPDYTRYGISYSTKSDFSFNVSTPAAFASGLTANPTAVTSLSGDTTYYFHVWAYNGDEIMTVFDSTNTTTATAPPPPSDPTPPAAISNLTALPGATIGTVNLKWTAPGDDGMTGGMARGYLVKWSLNQILDNDDFDAASDYDHGWDPINPGDEEGETGNRVVSGLSPGTTYYFAIRAYDDGIPGDPGWEGNPWGVIWPGDEYSENRNRAIAKSAFPFMKFINPDFESSPDLKGWTKEGTALTYITIVNDPDPAKTGDSACKINDPTGTIDNRGIHSSTSPVVAGNWHTVGASFYIDNNGSGVPTDTTIRIQARWSDGTIYSSTHTIGAFNEWRTALVSTTVPAGCNSVIMAIHVGEGGAADNNDVYIDDVFSITDTTPPSAITNLAASTGVNPGEITLQWTSPGDDGTLVDNINPWAKYVLRYATYSVSGSTWTWWVDNETNEYFQEWAVAPVGTNEEETLNLSPGATYYFILRTADAWNNYSDFDEVSVVGPQANAKAMENTDAFRIGSSIRINEVAPSETSTSDPEYDWIEFYNASTYTVNMTNWEVFEVYVGTISPIKTFGTFSLPSGEYLILHFNSGVTGGTDNTSPQLAENGDTYYDFYAVDSGLTDSDNGILLQTPAGTLIDAMFYTDASGGVTGSTNFRLGFNFARISSQWVGPEADGDNDEYIERLYTVSSKFVAKGRSMARGPLSIDGTNPSKAEWQMHASPTPGAPTAGYANREPDSDIPETIADMTAVPGDNRGTVKLTWTAPGEDKGANQAELYIVRYADYPLNEDNFDDAENEFGDGSFMYVYQAGLTEWRTWNPAVRNNPENYALGSLSPGTTYYIAIKTEDEQPNRSEISNVVSVYASNNVGSNVRINEIAPAETANDWIELYNTTDAAIDLSGWTLCRNIEGTDISGEITAGTDYSVIKTFPAGFSLPAKSYLVVNLGYATPPADEVSGDTNDNGYYDFYTTGGLVDTDGLIFIRGKGGTFVDAMVYADGVGSEPAWTNLWLWLNGHHQWAPAAASQASAANWAGGGAGFSLDRSSTSVDTDDTVSARDDWNLWSAPTKGVVNELDIIPPAAITNLAAVSGDDAGKIDLSWTATGDDGLDKNNGDGRYRLRYATYCVTSSTSAWWDNNSANEEVLLNPADVGVTENKTLFNLVPGATYYFAIKAYDSSYNPSEIDVLARSSNTATMQAHTIATASDIIPPAAISDLTALTGGALGTIRLVWTAPGDDGTIKNATGYLVKYSQSQISEANFDDATTYDHDWTPLNPGEEEGATGNRVVSGLMPGDTYYFAIKGYDNNVPVPNEGIWPDGQYLGNKNKTVAKDFGNLLKLPNSGFESSPSLLGWTRNSSYITTSANYAMEGILSCKINDPTGTASSRELISSYARVVPGTTYNAGAYFLVEQKAGNVSNTLIDMEIKWYDNSLSEISALTSSGNTLSSFDAWQMLYMEATAPAGAVKAQFFIRCSENVNNNNDIYIDSVISEPDVTAPNAITNLTAYTGMAAGQIILTWTTPGDDGTVGDNQTGSKYEIMYATYPAENSADVWYWRASKRRYAPVSPQGTLDGYALTLSPGATYYFGIKTSDVSGNISEMDDKASSAATQAHSYACPGEVTKHIVINDVSAKDDWVELYNPLSSTQNIKGWSIWSMWFGKELITFGDWNFPPKSYLVLDFSKNTLTAIPFETDAGYYMAYSNADGISSTNEEGIVLYSDVTLNTASIVDAVCFSDFEFYYAMPYREQKVGGGTFAYGSYPVAGFDELIDAGHWPGSVEGTDDEIRQTLVLGRHLRKYTYFNPYLAEYKDSEYSGRSIARDENSTDIISDKSEWGVTTSLTKGLQNNPLDKEEPAKITTLAVVPGENSGTIRLTWIATGDDGTTGTASGYVIRYAKQSINTSNFENLSVASNWANAIVWYPKTAGQEESCLVAGLESNTTYYFSIVAEDERGNRSLPSNSPGARSGNIVGSFVRINEIASQERDGNDWIEIYNAHSQPVNISGWNLYQRSLDCTGDSTWYFEDGSYVLRTGDKHYTEEVLYSFNETLTLAPGDYVIVEFMKSGIDSVETNSDGTKTNYRYAFNQAKYESQVYDSQNLVMIRDNSDILIDCVMYSDRSSYFYEFLWRPLLTGVAYYGQWSPQMAEGNENYDNQYMAYFNAVGSGYSVNRDDYSNDTDGTGIPKDTNETGYSKDDWMVTGHTKGYKNDWTPPGPVTELYVVETSTEGVVQLTWTAPGDDGTNNNNTGGYYEGRYSTVSANITDYTNETWWDAVLPTGRFIVSNPGNIGTQETVVITGLYPGLEYYFCMKVYDDVYHVSAISTYTAILLNDSAPPKLVRAVPSWVRQSVSTSPIVDIVTIYWQAGPLDVAYYVVQRRDANDPDLDANYSGFSSTISAMTAYMTDTVQSTTTVYVYRVGAIDYRGQSSTKTAAGQTYNWLKITVYNDYAFPTITPAVLPNAVYMKGNNFKFTFSLNDSEGHIGGLTAVTPKISYYRGVAAVTTIASLPAILDGSGESDTYSGTFTVPADFVRDGNFAYYIEYTDYVSRSTKTLTINVTVLNSYTTTWVQADSPVTLPDGNSADGETSIYLGAVEGEVPTSLQITQTVIPVAASGFSFRPGTEAERVDISVNGGMPVICWDIIPKDADGCDMNVKFTNPVQITLLYLDSDKGESDTIYSDSSVHLSTGTVVGVKESRLKAYFLDERNHVWRFIGGDQNRAKNIVSFKFPHLSRFALFATVAGGIRPVQRFLTARTPVNFDEATRVIIYDPRGRPVVTLTTSAPTTSPIVWYGADYESSSAVSASQMVESGAYIYESTGAGGAKATGVIIVVK